MVVGNSSLQFKVDVRARKAIHRLEFQARRRAVAAASGLKTRHYAYLIRRVWGLWGVPGIVATCKTSLPPDWEHVCPFVGLV